MRCSCRWSRSALGGRFVRHTDVRFAQGRNFFPISRAFSTDVVEERLIPVPESRLDELMQAEIAYLQTAPIRAVSMHEVLDCLEPRRIAKFIQSENVKRLAFRIRLIESLSCWKRVPELVSIQENLHSWYRELRLAKRGPDTGLKDFTSCIIGMREKGNDQILRLAIGMHKVKAIAGDEYDDEFMNRWMDSFLLSRIGSNMLLDQYRACTKKEDGGLGRALGIINPRCDPTAICNEAAKRATRVCLHHTGDAPPVTVETYKAGRRETQAGSDVLFSYIPGFLLYIMIELLKNSMNATVKHVPGPELVDHPVHIVVSTDEKRIVIRISDRAGGIPLEVGDKVWSYLYGAAAKGDATATPLAGYGVGLPLSRLYARYLGGQLELRSVPGLGTDAYLLLHRLEADQVEAVPSLPTE